jgi:hypothetical protein
MVFHFSKSDEVLIVENREIDGVTVLLSPEAIENDFRHGHPNWGTTEGVWILRPNGRYDFQRWWGHLLKEHPKFAEWLYPGFTNGR